LIFWRSFAVNYSHETVDSKCNEWALMGCSVLFYNVKPTEKDLF